MRESLYEILQVSPNAEQEVIEAAYRRLCRKYHPDVNRDPGAEKRMHQFVEAYAVLRDPGRRRAYDRQWRRPAAPPRSQAPSAFHRPAPRPEASRDAGTSEPDDAARLEAGRRTLAQYFVFLREQRWHKAYALLCQEDRQRVALEDYVAWQEAVSAMYQIGEVTVTLYRAHHKHGRLVEAEFIAEGREVEVATDHWQAFVSAKTLMPVAEGWRILLGYEDVRALAARFRLMAESRHPRVLAPEALFRLTGQEAYRATRFGHALTLAAFSVQPETPVDAYPSLWEAKKLNWVSRAMNRLRLTDVLAWTESGEGVLVLPHTDLQQAHVALRKLAEALKEMAAEDGTGLRVVGCASTMDGSSVEEWHARLMKHLHTKLMEREQADGGQGPIGAGGLPKGSVNQNSDPTPG